MLQVDRERGRGKDVRRTSGGRGRAAATRARTSASLNPLLYRYMDLHIEGRTAVITGAAGDIGRATARLLLDDGAHVLLTDIDEDELQAAVKALGGESDRVRAAVADLTDQAEADRLWRIGV